MPQNNSIGKFNVPCASNNFLEKETIYILNTPTEVYTIPF